MHEFDEEERWDPTSMDQWKKQMTIFKNSLLMCTWMFPQYSSFDLDVQSIDEFYEFLYGPTIATRTPAPSLKVLMVTERKAWRQVALDLHKGISLKTSLSNVRADSLFWQKEIYERLHSPSDPWSPRQYYPSPKGGKGNQTNKKGQWTQFQPQAEYQAYPPPQYPPTPTWQPKSPGKGKGKGKIKGKPGKPGKGKPGSWPSNWATVDPRGKQYCMNALLKGACSGGCGRSHQCPVKTATGVACNGNHLPDACPNK